MARPGTHVGLRGVGYERCRLHMVVQRAALEGERAVFC